tara:strand:+ start:1029 stop:1433 length:405 start_codon:yes stop_codon:yes gene_type:complete
MIRRLIILLLIVGFGIGEDLPPESVLHNMTYDEKLDLYNSKRITFLKNALIGYRLPYSKSEKKIAIIGSVFTPILIYGMFYKIENDNDRKWSSCLINLGGTGYTVASFFLLHEREKQRKLYNDRLYKKIFFINQ